MSQNLSYKLLKQNFDNQKRLHTHLQKLIQIRDNFDLEFNLNVVLQIKTLDLSTTSSSIVTNNQFMTLSDIIDELIFRDSFNTIYEFCKTDTKLKKRLFEQDWFYVVKFLRDFLTHGRVRTKFFKNKEWKNHHSKHGFVVTWRNIEHSIMPKIPKRKRPYLKFFQDMKKFVKELEAEYM